MNDILRVVEYKLVKVITHLNRLVDYIHLLGCVSLNMNIRRFSQQVLGSFRTADQLVNFLASVS